MDTSVIAAFIASLDLLHPGLHAVADAARVENRNGRLQLVVDFHMEHDQPTNPQGAPHAID